MFIHNIDFNNMPLKLRGEHISRNSKLFDVTSAYGLGSNTCSWPYTVCTFTCIVGIQTPASWWQSLAQAATCHVGYLGVRPQYPLIVHLNENCTPPPLPQPPPPFSLPLPVSNSISTATMYDVGEQRWPVGWVFCQDECFGRGSSAPYPPQRAV